MALTCTGTTQAVNLVTKPAAGTHCRFTVTDTRLWERDIKDVWLS